MQAVREGRLRKQQRIYALPGASEAMAAARDLGGTLSHASAAQRWGLDLLSPPEAHQVTVPRRARRRRVPEDVRLHYADLQPGEVDEGVTVVPRTVLDCARSLPVPESLAISDSAMRRFLLHPTELPPLLVGLRGPGAPSAALVLRALDSGAADVFESALRAILLEGGIRGFVPQREVRDGRRLVAQVDLGDPQRRIALEAESFAWHGDRCALSGPPSTCATLHGRSDQITSVSG